MTSILCNSSQHRLCSFLCIVNWQTMAGLSTAYMEAIMRAFTKRCTNAVQFVVERELQQNIRIRHLLNFPVSFSCLVGVVDLIVKKSAACARQLAISWNVMHSWNWCKHLSVARFYWDFYSDLLTLLPLSLRQNPVLLWTEWSPWRRRSWCHIRTCRRPNGTGQFVQFHLLQGFHQLPQRHLSINYRHEFSSTLASSIHARFSVNRLLQTTHRN